MSPPVERSWWRTITIIVLTAVFVVGSFLFAARAKSEGWGLGARITGTVQPGFAAVALLLLVVALAGLILLGIRWKLREFWMWVAVALIALAFLLVVGLLLSEPPSD